MWHSALVTACLVAVALAGPVAQGPYNVRRPLNSVSLHADARQRNHNSGRQQFVVTRDDDSLEDAVLSLQGIGNFAATASQSSLGSSVRSQGAPQSFNIDGGASFNVALDDNSRESVEVTLGSFATSPVQCPAGQLRHGSKCVVPRINRNIFVFGRDDSPEQKSIDSVEIPLPQLDYNIIFVRSRPEKQRKKVVVPPPQKKTVVYVLEDEETGKDLIEVPSYPDADPEVYYVKVRPGENPQLPGGLDLETAYSQAIRPSGSQETSFESSIELNIGAAGFGGSAQGAATFNSGDAGFSSSGSVGVPLPDFRETGSDQGFNTDFNSGSSAFGGDAGFDSGSTSFANGNAGFDSGFSGAGSFDSGFGGAGSFDSGSSGNAAFDSGSSGNAAFDSGSGGSAGFDSGFGGNAGFDSGFNSGSGSVGVPLPTFNGANTDSNSGSSGFNSGFRLDSGDSQTFSGNAQFTAETSFGNGQGFNSNANFAAKGLSIEVDDGRIKVEASSDEVVQPALRYRLPSSG